MSNLFESGLNQYRQTVDNFLSNGSLRRFFDKYDCDSIMENYYDVFVRHTQGGKRIRAYLVKIGYELSGNKSDDKIVVPSLSCELFQTGVLVHDDIIDKSDSRRHRPSMHVELGNDHVAVSKAICIGDFGIVAANDVIAHSDFDDTIKIKAIAHQNSVFIKTFAGEIRDVELSEYRLAPADKILDMYKCKTAWYSVAGPLVLGAILSGADNEFIDKLCEFGINAGIAFQIKDDILGIFGDEKVLGKSVTSDICEGKKTILLSHFLDNASQEDKRSFFNIYGMAMCDDNQLETVRWLLTRNKSLDYAQNMCVEFTHKAKECLDELDISEQNKSILCDLLSYLVDRNY